MISVAGPEPAASSSRIRIMGGLYLVWRLYALLIALVGIGLPRSSQRILSSFAPRSLPVVLMSDDLEPVRASRRASLAQPGAVWLPPVCDGSQRDGRASQSRR